jgi:hypothetical protein
MTRLNEYVKTAEAARILGVSQNTVRDWAEAGKIPMRRNPVTDIPSFFGGTWIGSWPSSPSQSRIDT